MRGSSKCVKCSYKPSKLLKIRFIVIKISYRQKSQIRRRVQKKDFRSKMRVSHKSIHMQRCSIAGCHAQDMVQRKWVQKKPYEVKKEKANRNTPSTSWVRWASEWNSGCWTEYQARERLLARCTAGCMTCSLGAPRDWTKFERFWASHMYMISAKMRFDPHPKMILPTQIKNYKPLKLCVRPPQILFRLPMNVLTPLWG